MNETRHPIGMDLVIDVAIEIVTKQINEAIKTRASPSNMVDLLSKLQDLSERRITGIKLVKGGGKGEILR